MRPAYILGVGMTKFDKPGTKSGDYPDWVGQAATQALGDARTDYEQVDEVFAGFCLADSTAGQRAIYPLGMTGVPVTNVNNNCATGSTALSLAIRGIRSGTTQCALAVGFERMTMGALRPQHPEVTSPLDRHIKLVDADYGWRADVPLAPQLFGTAAREHMERYGSTTEDLARVAVKNHLHSQDNPNAQFRTPYDLDEVLSSPTVFDPLTRLQCSPTSDGAAVAVLAGPEFVDRHGLWDRAVEVVGSALVSDTMASFSGSMIDMVGFPMTSRAADTAFEQAGLARDDIDVIELHDCFSINEIITYEALGIAARGRGHALLSSGATTRGGAGPTVNPSGGLISKGHPLGATGIAQCVEIVWQLRGEACARQVINAQVGLTHNIGLGGAAFVGIFRSAAPNG